MGRVGGVGVVPSGPVFCRSAAARVRYTRARENMSAFAEAMFDQLRGRDRDVTFPMRVAGGRGLECPCRDFLYLRGEEQPLNNSLMIDSRFACAASCEGLRSMQGGMRRVIILGMGRADSPASRLSPKGCPTCVPRVMGEYAQRVSENRCVHLRLTSSSRCNG